MTPRPTGCIFRAVSAEVSGEERSARTFPNDAPTQSVLLSRDKQLAGIVALADLETKDPAKAGRPPKRHLLRDSRVR